MKIFTLILVLTLSLTGLDTQAAKRLGGGSSVGKQSNQVSQQQTAKPQTPPPPTPTATPRRPWGAMLGGLAAGLGLAWLAHSLGFGEAFGEILLFGLLAALVMLLVGWFIRSRQQAANRSLRVAPAGFSPRNYSADHVGNDASARPWERSSMAFQASNLPAQAVPATGAAVGSALARSVGWGIPADFDTASFLAASKRHFINLQDAWDRADMPVLRAMMTDPMLLEIQAQLREREAHTGSQQPNKTEVMVLEAQLLGIEEEGSAHIASVEFSGMIREDAASGPNPFREVWNLSKSKSGSGGWLVAGVQALQ